MQRLLRRAFKTVEVTSVKSGEEVLQTLATNERKWDIVISDWNIDGRMTGGDIYNLIQVEYPNVAGSYMFMSDSRFAELLCTGAGLEFVEKPSSPTRILEAVRNTLSKRT
jgi:DNA-binding NtrC family response regulator